MNLCIINPYLKMKKSIVYQIKFFITLFLLTLFSCNNESDIIDSKEQQIKDYELVSLKDYSTLTKTFKSQDKQDPFILKFKDEASFERTLKQLQQMTYEERILWMQNLEGFNSLQDLFEQALSDFDNVDETESSYMAFKQKYEQYLYFPMYKEDMGFYLPIIEEEKAILANLNGLVIVGEEIRNLKNIFNYSDLQTTGKAYYDLNNSMTLKATALVNSSTVSDFIGDEVDSGWFYDSDGDRKLRFKFGRKSNKQNINPIPPSTSGFNFRMYLKLEISFRKKTWLGWANYKSETNTNMKFFIEGREFTYNFHKKADSSHDWLDSNPLPWGITGNYDNGKPIYITPPISAEFRTEFRAFDGTPVIVWTCYLPEATFVEF